MSVNISVSNNKQQNCNDIVQKFLLAGINSRIIETVSTIDNTIEKGCLITLDKKYSEKNKLKNVWNLIKDDYLCCHVKIDGQFDDCIYNYINKDLCPGK